MQSILFDEIDNDPEIIEEGPVSIVSRKWGTVNGGDSRWIAIKTASISRAFLKEPHDIVKELRLLSFLSHPNIIPVLGHFWDKRMSTLEFCMPYIPDSLSNLLSSPSFSPHPFLYPKNIDSDTNPRSSESPFSALTKSILFQLFSAVAYLHDEAIAHRDIKPNNVLLDSNACVKLIDFGISWRADEDQIAKQTDLWPEYTEHMYFGVSTGPYRAPELLFGTRSYDAFATDLWSLGCIAAEFFTSLRLFPDDEDFDDEYTVPDVDDRAKPFVFPDFIQASNPTARWQRDSLFDASRGEIGLAWSIFKIRGTPTEETWPTFNDLPHASSVTFTNVPPVDLSTLLPNLPPSDPDPVVTSSPLNLINSFLIYLPTQRLKVVEALQHPWFATGPLLLPSKYPSEYIPAGSSPPRIISTLSNQTAGEWLSRTLLRGVERLSDAVAVS